MSRVGNTVGNVITKLEVYDCLDKILLQDYDGSLVNFNIEEDESGVLVIYPYFDDEDILSRSKQKLNVIYPYFDDEG